MADALSRREEDVEEFGKNQAQHCTVTTIVEPIWLEQVREMIEQSYFKELQKKFSAGALPYSHYKLVNGIWFYKERILLDPAAALCNTIFLDHHASPGGDHSGYHRTL